MSNEDVNKNNSDSWIKSENVENGIKSRTISSSNKMFGKKSIAVGGNSDFYSNVRFSENYARGDNCCSHCGNNSTHPETSGTPSSQNRQNQSQNLQSHQNHQGHQSHQHHQNHQNQMSSRRFSSQCNISQSQQKNGVWTTTIDATGQPANEPGPIRNTKINNSINGKTRLNQIKQHFHTSDYESAGVTDTENGTEGNITVRIDNESDGKNVKFSENDKSGPTCQPKDQMESMTENISIENSIDRKLSSVGTQTSPASKSGSLNGQISEQIPDQSSNKARLKNCSESSSMLEPLKILKSAAAEMYLEKIDDWSFPIFKYSMETNYPLTCLAVKLFKQSNLFEMFKLPETKFRSFFCNLENGYHIVPYHNKLHATDVMQGVWSMTTQGIHSFSPPMKVSNIACPNSLAAVIPALELMALYLAAAMHDYDHPGRTNTFLVETADPLAILYNDRSVLEHHHAASSWKLLMEGENNFIENLPISERQRLRFLILDCILATDLKKHFDIVNQFKQIQEDNRVVNW